MTRFREITPIPYGVKVEIGFLEGFYSDLSSIRILRGVMSLFRNTIYEGRNTIQQKETSGWLQAIKRYSVTSEGITEDNHEFHKTFI